MVAYLEFLGQEIRSRRRALNLGHDEACLVLCDHATQHSAKKFTYMKEDFMKKHNAVPCRQYILFVSSTGYPHQDTLDVNLECVCVFTSLSIHN